MQLTTYIHNSGQDELYIDYDPDYKEFILCAVGRNKNGDNISQLDLGGYNKKNMKKLIKIMKQYIKDQNGKNATTIH